jgi:hypothetical protein
MAGIQSGLLTSFAGNGRTRTPMAHPWRIRSRSHSSVSVRIVPLICRSRSSLFVVVRVGRICKQGVVGSSPIVSTASDQGECSQSDLWMAWISRAIEHLSNIRFRRPPRSAAVPAPRWSTQQALRARLRGRDPARASRAGK